MKTAMSATTWAIGNLAWSAPSLVQAGRSRSARPVSRLWPTAPPPAPARAPRPAAAFPRDRSAEYDRDDEDAALDDLEVRRIDRERGQEVLQQVDGHSPEQ